MPAITTPVFDGKIWRGLAKAYGVRFIAELFPSAKNPGYYHFSVVCMADDNNTSYVDSTKHAILADSALQMLTIALKREGLVITDMRWQEVANKAELLIEHPERPQTNGKA